MLPRGILKFRRDIYFLARPQHLQDWSPTWGASLARGASLATFRRATGGSGGCLLVCSLGARKGLVFWAALLSCDSEAT